MNRRRAAARLAAVGAVGAGLTIAATGTAFAWAPGSVTFTLDCVKAPAGHAKFSTVDVQITSTDSNPGTVTILDHTKNDTPVIMPTPIKPHGQATAVAKWLGSGDTWVVLINGQEKVWSTTVTAQNCKPATPPATETSSTPASSMPTVAPTSKAPVVPANESSSAAAVAPAQTGKPLAATGSSNTPMLAGIAGGAVVIGAGAVVATRRLRRGEH